jgi:hypothetical protein
VFLERLLLVSYEAEAGDLNLVAVGDTILVRPLHMFREKRFLALVDLIRNADVSFSNPEILFHNHEMPPAAMPHVSYVVAHPRIIQDFKWLGFDLLCDAHSHSWDYGVEGLLTTLRRLDEQGIIHAGAGRNLSEARAPAYLETAKGRVALLSCVTSFQGAARAGEQRPDHMGRPGISFLRHKRVYTVTRQSLDVMRLMSAKLGVEEEKAYWRRMASVFSTLPVPDDTDIDFHFLGNHFRLGEEFNVTSIPDEEDMRDILRWVREARRQADWVLMSVHSHEYGNGERGKGVEDPPDFLQTFARRCIDEGVDTFLGHGPHFIRGIEVYRGRPIFYGLGNFVFQNEVYPTLPADSYSWFQLGHHHTPADLYDAKTRIGRTDSKLEDIYWEGLVAQPVFKAWKLKEIRLHIADLQQDQPRSQHGRPMLALEEVASRSLERLARLSRPYETEIEIKDGVGYINV